MRETKSDLFIVEASISSLLSALSSGKTTAVDIAQTCIARIDAYDRSGPRLNSITAINPNVIKEAEKSDQYRASGKPLRPLEGIPYTLKDSYKYKGMTVACGSPAFKDLMSDEDAYIAKLLREAGAVMIGKTNMPPMACGGMQLGLFGRPESPYNLDYLTAAFSSGSSSGSATSTTASFAAFGMGSETVSSGRSPASNNALIAYTPTKGVLSCRGLWPLYPTCDVPVPHTRRVEDMAILLDIITKPDPIVRGDFWREQTYVDIPKVPLEPKWVDLLDGRALSGKRLAVPKMYIGGNDPKAKIVTTCQEVLDVWVQTRKDLESLGAMLIETDFPVVTKYEDDSISGEANNVEGAPRDWSKLERSDIVSLAWDHFLREMKDAKIPNLGIVDPERIFPKPVGYIPDKFAEQKNFMSYPYLVKFASENGDKASVFDVPGMELAVKALEAQRKRDFEDWMDYHNVNAVVFPANGDVGRADLEENIESAEYALKNGIKYSNGNRAIRHLGIPTISVPMGIMRDKKMPINITFAGKAGQDKDLFALGYAFEQGTKRRTPPPLTPPLPLDS
jgi:Asp-tRNA(Asn)/Glu-tRNA(Gln) amidotransferase A subunit family amidase